MPNSTDIIPGSTKLKESIKDSDSDDNFNAHRTSLNYCMQISVMIVDLESVMYYLDVYLFIIGC